MSRPNGRGFIEVSYKYKQNSQFKKVWVCVEQIIRIFQIVHTKRLKKLRVIELRSLISEFLKNVKRIFGIHLTPKLHYSTHYATVCERMGSLSDMSMIRMEAKHRMLKNVAQQTNNFKNINKTLAISHQESMCTKGNNFGDILSFTNRKKITLSFLRRYVNLNELGIIDEDDLCEFKRCTYNSISFEREKVFCYKSLFYELMIIFVVNSTIYFVAKELVYLGVDSFSQSMMVEPSDQQFELIKFDEIEHKKCHPMKSIDDKQFVLMDDIELLYEM